MYTLKEGAKVYYIGEEKLPGISRTKVYKIVEVIHLAGNTYFKLQLDPGDLFPWIDADKIKEVGFKEIFNGLGGGIKK